MTDYDYEDFNSETDSDENPDKEAKYQELVSEWYAELEVLTEKELLISIDYFIDEFTALGDYKDSAEKAEECSIKLKEIQEELQEELQEKTAKIPPKPEKSTFGRKCEELKSQIAALNETVKKDEEKIAALNSELAKINPQNLQKTLGLQKKVFVVIFIVAIIGTLGCAVGTVLLTIGIGPKWLGMAVGIISILLLLVGLPVISVCFGKKIDVGSTKKALEDSEKLSSSLDTAKKEAEKHKGELESKQKELEALLLGL